MTVIFITGLIPYLATIATSSYLMLKQKSIVKKICYGLIIVLNFYAAKNSQILLENDTSKVQVEFFCVGIVILLTSILIIFTREKLKIENT